jgi:hypothetical protein
MSSRRVPEIVRAARASSDGTARVAHLCDLAAGALPVNGVGLSLTGGRGRHSQVAATDEVSGKIEELQVLLGQGPCVDAMAAGAPVLVADMTRPLSGSDGRSSPRPPSTSASGRRSRSR